MSITIVIPAYNEAKSITSTLQKIAAYLSEKDMPLDIIIVDDGSTDNTIEVIKNQSIPVSLVKLGKNCGKGKAVREGMLKAKGDWSLFMDADGSTSIQELEKFIPLIKQQKDIIIGTRKIKGSEIIEHQPFLREFFGKGFTWLSNIIVHAHVSDFTCGFKCFSKKATEVIFSKAVIDDWSFDAEILFIAQKLGYEIIEIPVKWKNDRSSKVRLIHDILNSLKGLFRIRLNAIKGIYG